MQVLGDNVVLSAEEKAILQDFVKMQRKRTETATSLNGQMEIEKAQENKVEIAEEIETILKVPLKNKEREKEAPQVPHQKRSVTKKENARIQDKSVSTKKETTQITRKRSLPVAEIIIRAENTKEVEVPN
jgi:hypothetical protein